MRILVIAPRFPWPLEKGDKLRLYQQIFHLRKHHEICLFAVNHQPIPADWLDKLRPLCASIQVEIISPWRLLFNMLRVFTSSLPASVAYFTDKRVMNSLQQYHDKVAPDVTYGQLVRTAEYLLMLPGPKVLDFMDAFSAITLQQARESFWLRKWLYKWEGRRLQRYERQVGDQVDARVYISERDRSLLDPENLWGGIVIPNGIDTGYFQPPAEVAPAEYDITFVGNLGYFPNVEAAEYLVSKVLPETSRRGFSPSILIAGARPHARVLALAAKGVNVRGWLPDIREAYLGARLFVAPIFYGAGLQNKILEAMAMCLPVITTTHVNAAIGGEPGKHLLQADTPEEFANAIALLLQDETRREQIARAGQDFVRTNFRWEDSVLALVQQAFLPLIPPS